MKEPWGEGTPWKNSVAFFTYLRGCLRKAWSNNPIKHNLIKKVRKQIDNPNPNGKKKTVFGFTCELCHNDFVLSQGQVDHKVAAGSLRKTEDIQGFVERLLYVTEDDLRLICKGCNSALAYADKQGVTFAQALIDKEIIAIMNAKTDRQWLIDHDIVPASNAQKRREQIEERMKNDNISSDINDN